VVSRLVHRLGSFSESAVASLMAVTVSAVFLIGAVQARHAGPWISAFEVLAAAVTLVMVFVLQHTQSRQQAAVQRKLDEILRVLPGADARVVHVETATERELDVIGAQHQQVRDDAVRHPEQ
jgi:low affinity Fe/Cu permease